MQNEKKKIIYSLIFPLFFLLIIWFIKITEYLYDFQLYKYGIYPLRTENLIGIIFSPLIHGDFDHLMSNSIPFLILASALFYFYKNFAFLVFWLIYFVSGLCC